MKKQFYWIFLVGLLLVSLAGMAKNYPTMTVEGKNYYLYTVQKSEGLYSISQRFNVPQTLIIEANPGIENGLILGQLLKIPQVDTAEVEQDTTSINLGKNQHVVKPKDTLYSLSKKYNCTVDELLDLNPWATHLTIGAVLQIPTQPTKTEVVSQPVVEPQPSITNKVMEVESPTLATVPTENEVETNFEATPVSSMKIAILLPFMLDAGHRDASMNRFVDFYQGCVLAADTMAQKGFSTEFYTYDIGKDAAKLQSVLNEASLSKVDLIIGPAYKDQVGLVAAYAQAHKIPTVIPFTSNVAGIHDNPYLFEVVTPQKNFYGNLLEKLSALFIDKHIILVEPSIAAHNNKAAFKQQLKDSILANNISFNTMSDVNLAKRIDSVATQHPDKECVVVMPTTHGVALSKLGEVMNQVRKPNVALFAFPEWNNVGVDELYSTKVYQFSSYYTSFNDPRIVHFYQSLKHKFGLPTTIQQSPNFALFGYDICNFFMQQYQLSGDEFIHLIPETETSGLQMNFLFEQVDNGGYWNVGTIIKQITKDGISDL